MVKPDYNYKIMPNSGVFTFGALEQLGGKFEKFFNYLIKNRPKIVIHTEPCIELYDHKGQLLAEIKSTDNDQFNMIFKITIQSAD